MGTVRVRFIRMEDEFRRVLLKVGFSPEHADLCASIFAESTMDGVTSHGLGMFPYFVRQIQEGKVKVHAEPERVSALGAWEQWDGKSGPGPMNATLCTDRAVQLARDHGMGCVALRNTNHWMRGGTYGWQAAEAGCVFMGWTNTIALMPPWGGERLPARQQPAGLGRSQRRQARSTRYGHESILRREIGKLQTREEDTAGPWRV